MRFLDEDEKRELRSHLKEYLIECGLATAEQISRGQNFCCPGENHNDDSPSAHYYDDPKCPHVYCFGCGESWDLLKLIAEHEHKPSFEDQVARARELYGDMRTEDRPVPVLKPQTQNKAVPLREIDKKEIAALIDESQKHLEETDYYLRRGLSLAFAKAQGLGYNPENHRLIIPTDTGYVARSVLPYENIPRYLNIKGLKVSLAGAKCLEQKDPVFVVEGIFDALAIRQAGFQAISLNSTSNIKLLVEAVKNSKEAPDIIITLDNDDTGRGKAVELKEMLTSVGASSKLILNAWGDFKDAGEFLEKAGNDSLKERLGLVMDMEESKIEIIKDDETYAAMYHRLKENKPTHATDDLLQYWEKVINEIKDTVIQLHRAEKQCKVLKLWSVAIETAAKEFDMQPEQVDPIRQELSNIEAKAEQDLKDWQYIMQSMEKLEFFSNNLIDSVMEMREKNPLMKLPEVQHAMAADEALREPPKRKPDEIYFALLREAVRSKTGILTDEADMIIAERLKAHKKGEKEIAKCLSHSPGLRNLPEKTRMSTAEAIVRNTGKSKGSMR